jgi:RimJ/RimL family protein N-acetyltransferase
MKRPVMKIKTIKIFSFLLIVLAWTYQGHGSTGYPEDYEAQGTEGKFYSWYQKASSLPILSVSGVGENPEELLLNPVTFSNISYLEILQEKLSGQYAPELSTERSVKLFEANLDFTSSQRGWIIWHAQSKKNIGFITYAYAVLGAEGFIHHSPSVFNNEKRCFEFEWYIAPNHQKKGYARAAFQAVLDYIQRTPQEKSNIDSVIALIAPKNETSKKFARRNGFSYVALAQNRLNKYTEEIWERPLQHLSSDISIVQENE